MELLSNYFRELRSAALDGWDRFWFTPAPAHTLGLVRILAGAMMFYTHLVWTLDLDAFFGSQSWLDHAAVAALQADGSAWSPLWLCEPRVVLPVVHLTALIVFACLSLGIWTKTSSILSFVLVVSYAQRAPLAMFGLDQINALLALYLAIGPAGDALSVDRWRARHWSVVEPHAPPSVGANISIRLIQLHLCVIYLFAGLSKLQGPAWWNGSALWYAFANLEYQSLDMTWTAHHPWLVNLMSHTVLVWEISYVALVWPRLTRPLVLAMAVPLHMGIAMCLGMSTFGLVMLIANVAFVDPALIASLVRRRQPEPQPVRLARIPAPHTRLATQVRIRH